MLAVPATASAMPSREATVTPPQSAPNYTHAAGQPWTGTQVAPQSGPVAAPFKRSTAQQSSSFDWNQALIGTGITLAIMTLALGGALIARRQGRLQFR
jgi:hypothetical protein